MYFKPNKMRSSIMKEEYLEDFVEFLKTGNCSEEFKDYMNEDEDCQMAVDMALKEKLKRIYNIFGKEI